MKIITGIAVATALLTMLTLNVKADETARSIVTVTVGMQEKNGEALHQEAKWTVRCKHKPTVISYGTKVEITGIAGRECIAWAKTNSHRGWMVMELERNLTARIRMTELK